jgi:hypothetical protein
LEALNYPLSRDIPQRGNKKRKIRLLHKVFADLFDFYPYLTIITGVCQVFFGEPAEFMFFTVQPHFSRNPGEIPGGGL